MGPRSTSRSISDDDTLVVAQIRGPHGVRGEVRVDPRTDVPDRFAPGVVLDCDGVGPVKIVSRRGEDSEPILRFDGYATRESVDGLSEKFLRVSAADARAHVAPGAYLWRDLVGLEVVTPEGRSVGTVRDLIRAGGADVLVIDAAGTETLLPMIDSVIRSIDIAAGRILATPQEELG